ncbi:hypothetical protein PHISCL_06584 [Aspergillus sclerotialis]|uniref:Uncharacterized protein n=1 Tax=Aspergillus sclerotialis TaxID=2070753 RepID=A0A3A2ZEQ0_9EURO|nr:hypothetical protein PHISCL_06584 [Aspergillus sclerotialis]
MELRYDLAALGPLNLFAFTSAMHSEIFQYRNSWGTVQLLPPIQNALRNWRDIWQLSTTLPSISPDVLDSSDIPADRMWERHGFWKHCPEYWLLADLMVTHLSEICASPGERLADQSQADCLYGPVDSILNKYDQTSMRQVNELISSFQKCQIR